MCHVIACLWHILLIIEEKVLNIEDNWIRLNNMQEEEAHVLYLEAFYWAVATIMLIGTKGVTFYETLFVTITLLLTVGVFAYLISTVQIIIQELNIDIKQYKNDLEVINKYIKKKNINPITQQKIRGSIEYLHQDSKEINNTLKANQVLDKLPKSLKDEIILEINTSQMHYFPFIENNFSKKSQEDLKKCIQEKNYVTNEIVFSQNSEDEEIAIFYVQSGQIEITFKQDRQKPFQILEYQEGDVFGDLNFISGFQYIYQAKTVQFATLIYINREDFLNVLRQNQEDYERFVMIQEQVQRQGFSKYYNRRKCHICNLRNHNEESCTLLHYRPNKGNIYLKSQLSYPEVNRLRYIRRNFKFQSRNINLMMLLQDYVYYKIQNDEQFMEFLEFNENLVINQQKTFYDLYEEDSFGEEENQNDFTLSSEADLESITSIKINTISVGDIQKANVMNNSSYSSYDPISQQSYSQLQPVMKKQQSSSKNNKSEKENQNDKGFHRQETKKRKSIDHSQYSNNIQQKQQKIKSKMENKILQKYSENVQVNFIQLYSNLSQIVKCFQQNFPNSNLQKCDLNIPNFQIQQQQMQSNINTNNSLQQGSKNVQNKYSQINNQGQQNIYSNQINSNLAFFLNFEKQHNWRIYYPFYNLPILVKKYKMLHKKRRQSVFTIQQIVNRKTKSNNNVIQSSHKLSVNQ